jgi:D-alanyl-D-alanine carboxypeptidase (penicillin-binding protein 5/6)
VSQRAWDERKGDPSLMFIDTTMRPTVDELLHGMIVVSGNDASVALAEAVGGSVETFVAMMNRQAQAWGLKNTAFKNVTGLTEAGHKASARDVAIIASHIVRDFPQYYRYYSIRDYTYNKIRQDNRNLLLRRDPTVDGMKTGYTDAAGYCLVASAAREYPNLGAGQKRRLLSVVLGTASREARASESQKLLNWGFTAFDPVRLFEAGKPIVTPEVWKGTARQAKLGAEGAVVVAVPRGEGDKLKTQVVRTDPLVAPLAQGQRVGTVKVTTAAGTPVAEVPLVVQEAVEQAGLLGRAWDAIRLWIK